MYLPSGVRVIMSDETVPSTLEMYEVGFLSEVWAFQPESQHVRRLSANADKIPTVRHRREPLISNVAIGIAVVPKL